MNRRSGLSNQRRKIESPAESPVAWLQKKKKAVVNREQQSFLQKILFRISLFKTDYTNKISSYFTISGIVFGIFLIVLLIFFYNNYKTESVRINKLSYINEGEMEVSLSNYFRDKSFFKVNNEDFKGYMMSEFALIEEIYLNKSLITGYNINITEYEPSAFIQLSDGNIYFLTNDGKMFKYSDKVLPKTVLSFDGKADDVKRTGELATKCILFTKKLEQIGVKGKYIFDNFGNFTILTPENKIIKLDLNERFFSIDEQVKVLQNTLVKANNNELDLRYNYVIGK